ncbi:MAG: hypothetical protein HYR90_02885 [Candidatus Andersenbacteria bacterium]|nr:hypothetical protein [Candidatus Andersenbacteria bacterium]MBI3251103.1 hypothetical protein [Candidatus Andersenbacteria bacterium]
MNQADKNRSFRTPDLKIGSYVYAEHPELFQGVERQGRQCWFVFSNPDGQCERLQQAFYNNSGMVSVRAFTEAERTLKDLIFSAERRGYAT